MNNCIIIGGGNSLRGFDFSKLNDTIPIFSMNSHVLELMTRGLLCDYWTFWDLENYTKYKEELEYLKELIEIHTINQYDLGLFKEWKVSKEDCISREPDTVGNMNSGLAFTIYIAIHKGFDTIYLLGFENKITDFVHWWDEELPSKQTLNLYNTAFKKFNKFMVQIDKDLQHEELIGVNSGFDFIKNIGFNELINT